MLHHILPLTCALSPFSLLQIDREAVDALKQLTLSYAPSGAPPAGHRAGPSPMYACSDKLARYSAWGADCIEALRAVAHGCTAASPAAQAAKLQPAGDAEMRYAAMVALRHAAAHSRVLPALRRAASYTDDDVWRGALLIAELHYPLESLDWVDAALDALAGKRLRQAVVSWLFSRGLHRCHDG